MGRQMKTYCDMCNKEINVFKEKYFKINIEGRGKDLGLLRCKTLYCCEECFNKTNLPLIDRHNRGFIEEELEEER